MRGYCPYCEHETDLTRVSTEDEFNIRGEIIPISVNYIRCEEFGHTFDDPGSDDDPVDQAYREYRSRHGFLQPEEIRDIRLARGLTQKELAGLLGFGGATLSRYENGALQSEGHDNMLQLASDAKNLLRLAKTAESRLPAETLDRLTQQLENEILEQQPGLRVVFERDFGHYESSELSGFKELDVDKLLASILFFCADDAVFKTKLNKLLFYGDFRHFKSYSTSITGSQYAHLPYGPAPNHYDLLLAMLHEDGKINLKEQAFPGYVGEIVETREPPDMSLFSVAEVSTLAQIKAYFAKQNSTQISEQSHKEEGFERTKDGELISYEYAESLTI